MCPNSPNIWIKGPATFWLGQPPPLSTKNSKIVDAQKVPQHFWIGLIQVKEERWTGISKGWQGYSEAFPEGEARGKLRGAALPARGKPRPS